MKPSIDSHVGGFASLKRFQEHSQQVRKLVDSGPMKTCEASQKVCHQGADFPLGINEGHRLSSSANRFRQTSHLFVKLSHASSCRIVFLSSWFLAISLLPGCNTLNPLCGSARPKPSLNSISPATMVFSQLPPSFVITATGSHFVSSSVAVFNGVTLATTVTSSSELTVNITSSTIPAPGSFKVVVETP